MIQTHGTSRTSAHYARLAVQELEAIHLASLEVLQRVGVDVHNAQARDILVQGGAQVDGLRVRIPGHMVAEALAPKRLILYDRTGRVAMRAGGFTTYFGGGSDCLNILDHRTGQRRKPVLQDVVDAAVVVNALPNVSFAMSMFLPTDVPQEVADRFQMEAMLNHTTKPIIFVTTDFAGCQDAVEMAEAVAGGPDALERNPFVGCYINVTTGLRHNHEALQKLLYLAGKGVPATYTPSTQGGVTAPVTPVGALVVAQAGALVGLVLSQLQREGAPFIMPGWGGNMLDMRTTVQPYADPGKRALAAEMVHYLGLPMFALAGCSDSKSVDGQAAAEAALTLMTDVLGGGNLVHDLGYLESGLSGSLAQLVICSEILNWLGYFVGPVEITEETLALDLIDEIGPDGQFLEAEHTLRHFRERWYPTLFNRANFDRWAAGGGETLRQRASRQVDKILAEHQPEPLPEGISRALRHVVQRAASD